MTRFRRKWDGPRWRPGLDLANLGLLILGAIVVKAVWDTKVLDRWLSTETSAAVRWIVAGLVALMGLLDVFGGIGELGDGIRRGAKDPKTDRQSSGDTAV